MLQEPCKLNEEVAPEHVDADSSYESTEKSTAESIIADTSKVDMFISMHGKELPESYLLYIREKLLKMDNERLARLNMLQFKNPSHTLVVSIFFGMLGVDRFIIGDVGAGLGKLLTWGGFGIWWIVDLFIIKENE